MRAGWKVRLRWQRSVGMRELVPALVQLYAVNRPAALLVVDVLWDAGSQREAANILEFLAMRWIKPVAGDEEKVEPDGPAPRGGMTIGW